MTSTPAADKNVTDALCDYFTDTLDPVSDARDWIDPTTMGIWFLFGLRTAVHHPEWALAIVEQDYIEYGYEETEEHRMKSREDSSALVTAIPLRMREVEA